ncbi:TPA: hypothetical protein ACIVXL_003090, partial [Salmonella enterica subsp. houtenae serovar 1,40:z4,z23:-]
QKLQVATRVQLFVHPNSSYKYCNIIQESYFSAVSIHHTIEPTPIVSPVWRDRFFYVHIPGVRV